MEWQGIYSVLAGLAGTVLTVCAVAAGYALKAAAERRLDRAVERMKTTVVSPDKDKTPGYVVSHRGLGQDVVWPEPPPSPRPSPGGRGSQEGPPQGRLDVTTPPRAATRTRWDSTFVKAMTRELENARKAHPRPINSLHEGYSVILEELDEFWEEVRPKTRNESNALDELIQVAAMCQRVAEDVLKVPTGPANLGRIKNK